MYNYFVLIGKLNKDAEITEFPDGKKTVKLELNVSEPFKNNNGEYTVKTYEINLWDFLVEEIIEKLVKGMTVSVKGRISINDWEIPNYKTVKAVSLIGEKIILLEKIN